MRKYAVFDIDGTLIRWQLYHVIVDRLAKQGSLGDEAYSVIQLARMKWKTRETPESFAEYEKVLISNYEVAITNLKTSEFDELVEGIIDEYKDQVYTYTRDLIKTLKSQGYFLLAISGSHHELVEKLAKYYKFDDWVGSKYERRGDSFSGEAYIPSFNKATALQEFLTKHQLSPSKSLAVGDSKSDVTMLELVENPIAFNPDKNLFEIAKTHKWKVVIERKNMIFQLEYKNGNYVLEQSD